jgi:hypothetical protein
MVVALDESISEAARVQHYVRVVGKQCQTISIQKQKRVQFILGYLFFSNSFFVES